MRLRLNRTEIACPSAFGALLLLFLFLSGKKLFPPLLALAFHEGGHLFAAHLLGLSVLRLEIGPFGGIMTVQGLQKAPAWKQFLLSAGGPVFSLLGAVLSPLFYRAGGIGFAFTRSLIRSHLLLLLLNLLPVPPLDGGRMAKALLGRIFSREHVEKVLNILCFLFCGGLFLLSLVFALRGVLELAPAFAGIFLFYAREAEKRTPVLSYASALIARRQRLEKGELIPVEALAVSPDTAYVQVLSRLSDASYHRLFVLSPDGLEKHAEIEENSFCDAVLKDPDGRIKDLLK